MNPLSNPMLWPSSVVWCNEFLFTNELIFWHAISG